MGLSSNLSSIGIVYEMEGNYPKALECYLEALSIFKEIGKSGIASVYSDLANIYAEQLDYKKSIEFSEKSLELDEEIGNQPGVSNNLINLGVTYCSPG